MGTNIDIIDEKQRVRALLSKMDGAIACNDYELMYALFGLLSKHIGRLMSVSGVK